MAKVYELKRPAYNAVARTLHWLVLLVAMQFVIGWTMPDG
jgi:cytochrome b561